MRGIITLPRVRERPKGRMATWQTRACATTASVTASPHVTCLLSYHPSLGPDSVVRRIRRNGRRLFEERDAISRHWPGHSAGGRFWAYCKAEAQLHRALRHRE